MCLLHNLWTIKDCVAQDIGEGQKEEARCLSIGVMSGKEKGGLGHRVYYAYIAHTFISQAWPDTAGAPAMARA
jgi:hypothetical protein